MKISKNIIGNRYVYAMARRYLKLMNQNSRKANLALFHIGRCGSTVLARSLEQNSQILWGHEIFQNIPNNSHLWHKQLSTVENAKAFLETRMYRSRTPYYGFDTKGMPEHDLNKDCLNMSLESYIELLKNNGVTHFVILKRENYIKRTISLLVARQKLQWHSLKRVADQTKVHIMLDNFNVIYDYHTTLLNHFSEVDDYYEKLERLLEGERLLEITYEMDIQNDPLVACKKVSDFIGVQFEVPEINMRRTNPFDVEEMVENYDELRDYLKDTKYNWMLKE